MCDYISMGKRIYTERKSQNISQKDLAAAVGVAPSTIQRYENGTFKKPKLPVIESIAKYLHVNPVWLIGKSEQRESVGIDFGTSYISNLLPLPEMHRVPLIGNIACGEPILCNEEYSYIETDIKADMCLRATGDSMINARIFDGDIVFIRSQQEVENGEIAAVIIDDSATLKRVYIQDGYVTLMAENPAYAPIVIQLNENSNIRILGKAIAFQSLVK